MSSACICHFVLTSLVVVVDFVFRRRRFRLVDLHHIVIVVDRSRRRRRCRLSPSSSSSRGISLYLCYIISFVCVIHFGDFLAFVRLSAVSLPKCEIRLVGVQVEL